jgi:SNF2 family DNA or RNA helicase
MALLHLGWFPQQQQFFIWGETWKPLPDEGFVPWEGVQPHPYCMDQKELAIFLNTLSKQGNGGVGRVADLLPAVLMASAPQSKVAGRKTTRTSRSSPSRGAAGNGKSSALQPTWGRATLPLLSKLVGQQEVSPIHSAALATPEESQPISENEVLHPWYLEGWFLSVVDLLPVLLALPLGQDTLTGSTFMAGGLRFWGHTARWGLNLLARGKFVPTIELTSQLQAAGWQPLLDSAADQERLRRMSLDMPLSCRCYQLPADQSGDLTCLQPLHDPQDLLRGFLGAMVDAQIRGSGQADLMASLNSLSGELPLKEWLLSLTNGDNRLEASPVAVSRLREALTTWTAPLQNLETDPTAQFRLRVVLNPPSGDDGQTWQLTYYLQSVANPDWCLSAESIWQHPVAELHYQGATLQSPQETLLAGLGRAARLYEPIRDSLQQPHPTHCDLDPIQTYQFIKAAAWQLQDNGFGVELPPGLALSSDDGASRLGLKVEAQVPQRQQQQRLGLKSLLNFKWELAIAGETLTAEEFEKLINQGSPIVEINGKWVELRPQDVKSAKQFLEGQKKAAPLSVEDALRISTGETQIIDKLPVVSFEASGALQKLIDTLTKGNQTLEPMAEPQGFKGTLRPYQARGVSWLAFLEQWGLGACLADDMGLGKTIQLIAFLLYLKENDWLTAPVLLVCPTSVLGNWQKEVKRFAPSLKTLVYHGDKRPKGSTFTKVMQNRHLLITSYSLVYRDLKQFQNMQWQCVVLDEAQNVKNPDAKQSKAVRQIDTQFRIALTGTPVENRLGELWSIMDFLNPGYLGPKNFFQKRFATPIERYGDTASLRTLKSLVQPFILRRLKTDRSIIQDLPDKQEMTIFCAMSAEQADLYQQTVDQALASLDETSGVQRKGQILALLTRLKQICNHPALFLQEKTLGLRGRSAKLQRLDEMLEEMIAEGDRALIFTQFAEWGKLLQRHLQSYLGSETLFLSGSTSKAQREAMVDRFQNDPAAPRLFILSLKAGGVGLNLTRANHVFHYDRWWNPAVENQATDRAFRIGQTRNVQVHKFVCSGTLEEKIHDMLESKKALSEQVVGTGEGWLTELDTDQLRNLLLLDRQAVIEDDDE